MCYLVVIKGLRAVPTGDVVRVPLPVPSVIVYSPDRVVATIPTMEAAAVAVT